MLRKTLLATSLVAMAAAVAANVSTAPAFAAPFDMDGHSANLPAAALRTATPIKHLVVLYDENVSFDHYFATYPKAANPPGEPAFTAAPGTPAVNGLHGDLLTDNPHFGPCDVRKRPSQFQVPAVTLAWSEAWNAGRSCGSIRLKKSCSVASSVSGVMPQTERLPGLA